MKKKRCVLVLSATLASTVLFSSCIGSFNLTSKLLDWNKSVDSKFVNELVFLAFWIVPVYEISILADLLILNSIEFWTGDNPVADAGKVEKISTQSGVYTVETKENGYSIQKEGGEAVDLVFDKADKSWSVDAQGESHKLMRYTADDRVVMYLPTGEEMCVELNQAGVLAFKQVANGFAYYAAR